MPKKCGHTPGRRVVPAEEMVTKIKVAVDARTRSDTLIVARTDALTQHGLDEALRRAELYAGAGADIIFIEAPESKEQMRSIAQRIGRPLLANMVDGGKTPMLSQAELRDIGYRLAIYPVTALLHAAGAVLAAYRSLKDGTVPAKTNEMAFSDFNMLIGFDEVRAIEARYAKEERASV
jgi:2-methylisocitrate lyase-like PEP mutase family enzyme